MLSGSIKKDESGRDEYSYPSILQAADGKINVSYTYRRFTIRIVRFDENWLKIGTRLEPL